MPRGRSPGESGVFRSGFPEFVTGVATNWRVRATELLELNFMMR
jgi:hypothetical protein